MLAGRQAVLAEPDEHSEQRQHLLLCVIRSDSVHGNSKAVTFRRTFTNLSAAYAACSKQGSFTDACASSTFIDRQTGAC